MSRWLGMTTMLGMTLLAKAEKDGKLEDEYEVKFYQHTAFIQGVYDVVASGPGNAIGLSWPHTPEQKSPFESPGWKAQAVTAGKRL